MASWSPNLKRRASDALPYFTSTTYRTRLSQARSWLLFLRRKIRQHLLWILIGLAATGLEIYYHVHTTSHVALKPLAQPLDLPFYTTCQSPPIDAARANATLLMLARNEDLFEAEAAIRSVEKKFNHWAHYPVTFLNDKPFNTTFINTLTEASSGKAEFVQIPSDMWSIPSHLDADKARKAMKQMGDDGMPYGGMESYHHMCRFNSGFFYDIPELQKYKWYWRIEPNVRFTCDITYDPFVEMERAGKKYGYIIALWELTPTVKTLYRKVSDYKKRLRLPTTRFWLSLVTPNPAPWLVRKIMAWTMYNRDSAGSEWNVCHFWSNFEIADMDWYRTPEYREFFRTMDLDGGFYLERWGDAPIHTLAAAILLKDEEIHHFRDWGYSHPPFQYIPAVPRDGRMDLENLVDKTQEQWEEQNVIQGCNCEVIVEAGGVIDPICHNLIQKAFS